MIADEVPPDEDFDARLRKAAKQIRSASSEGNGG